MSRLKRTARALLQRDIRGMIMLSAFFSGCLSTFDQSELAKRVMEWDGGGGTQSFLLPGTVILLEAVCLIVWNRAEASTTKWKAFWWAMFATAVSASLNITYARLHWNFAEVTEPLVWYLSIIPNLMLMASLKVGSLLMPARRKPEDVQEVTQEVTQESDTPPAELPAPTDKKPEVPTPGVGVWEVPRDTVMICLEEIASRLDAAGPEASVPEVLKEMTGSHLEGRYGRITARAWNDAKRDAISAWMQHRDSIVQLLSSRQSA